MRHFFRNRAALGQFTQLGGGVRLGRNIKLGDWSKIGRGAVIGDDVKLGPWSSVGAGARIGDRVDLGDYVKIGSGAVIGEGAVLPDHVHVQPGVEIRPGAVFDGNDLVTPQGVVPRRAGTMMHISDGPGHPVEVSGLIGRFAVPGDVDIDRLLDDYAWGRNDDLEAYRTAGEPSLLPDAAMHEAEDLEEESPTPEF